MPFRFNRQFRYEERTNEGYVKGRYGFYDKYGKLQVSDRTDIRPPPGPDHETKPDYLSKIHMYYLFCYLKIYSLFQVVNYEADPIHGFHAEGAGVPKYPH